MKSTIDKKLLPMKAHYFLFNAGTAPVVPFMPTLAKQFGFSTVDVGKIYTALPIVGMLAKPLFGFIADKLHRQKLLFLLFQILTAVSFFCIMFIPSIPRKPQVEFHCYSGESDVRFCPTTGNISDQCILNTLENQYPNKTVPCDVTCKAEPWMWDVICANWNVTGDKKSICPRENTSFEFNPLLRMDRIQDVRGCLYFIVHGGSMNGNNASFFCPKNDIDPYFKASCELTCHDEFIDGTMLREETIQNAGSFYQFWLFVLFMVLSWVGMAVVVSVGDAICFEMLGDKHHLYGKQRLFGALGWGIFSVVAGALVDKMSGGSVVKNYTIVFYMTAILIGFDMIASYQLQHTQTKFSTTFLRDVGKVFLSARVVIFFVWCILVGLCTALVWNFLFWYLELLWSSHAGCSNKNMMKTLQGLAMGIQCFGGEIPFFFLSGKILKKIGHINAMSVVLGGFGIRFLLYSCLTNPWWVLPIELMNGVTFGILYATMASYASIVAPAGTEATLQGLVGAVFEGIGVSSGSYIAGLSFELIGGSQTFRTFGFCALGACAVHVLVQCILQRISPSDGSSASYLTPNDAIHMLDDQEVHQPST